MILTTLALIPGLLIVWYIFGKDKVEKEPIGLLVKLVIFGGISCIPAAFLESLVDVPISSLQEGSIAYAVAISFLSAGLMEETCKFLLLKLGSWRNREFNYRFDGIVYGVAVACGFAMLENVMYVFEGGISVAITRAFLSVPLHAFCGAFMGAFYGMAKYKAVRGEKSDAFKCQICALIVPITIHGIFDSICFMELNMAVLVGYTVILYIIGLKMINRLESDDKEMCFYAQDELEAQGIYTYVPAYDSVQELEPEHHDRMKTTNGMSIASLVCGIVSFLSMCSFGLPAILAIIFGIIGKKQTAPGMKNAAAKAGIILGVIALIINALLLFYIYYYEGGYAAP